jgi:hypothetical protein
MTEFEIAMTYGARGTMAKAPEHLDHARRAVAAKRRDEAPAVTFEHLMAVLRQREPEPAVRAEPAGRSADEEVAWCRRP